jgi:cyclohexanecarboxylate-CoA ligase
VSDLTKAQQAYYDAGWWRSGTFVDDLRRNAAERPDKTAVIGHSNTTGRTDRVSYAELARLTDRMANGLVRFGVRRGEWVAVLLPDYWEMYALTLACVQAGVRMALVPPEYRRAELEMVYGLTESRLLITSVEAFGARPAETAVALSKDFGLPETVVVLRDEPPPGALPFADHLLADDGVVEPELAGRALSPDEPFLILFTSGTTGTTKAATHSLNTLYAGVRGYAEALDFDDTLVATTAHSNMYYVGLVTRLMTCNVLGGTAVCLDSWDPALSLELIAEHDVTTFYGSPHYARQLLAAARANPSRANKLASVVSGSAPVPTQLVDEVRDALGVRLFSLWGMSENGAVTCTRWDDPDDWPARSDGRPTGGMEVRIDPLPELADGTGRLWVRGPAQCVGYHKQDDIYTAQLDADGWFDTGDLARDDGRGGIRITGRAKDIIIYQSSNLPVAEIEAVLGTHPKVADIALIGIPDAHTDERVCAVVTTRGDSPPTLEELRDHLRDAGISDWCWPQQLEVVDAMPRTSSGKIRKVDLKARYATIPAGAADPGHGPW